MARVKHDDGSASCGPFDKRTDRPTGYNKENRTDCVMADGSIETMAAVLKERAELVTLKGRARIDAAHRLRQGMIGVLQSCLCSYPLDVSARPSGHHERCPADRMFTALQRAQEIVS